MGPMSELASVESSPADSVGSVESQSDGDGDGDGSRREEAGDERPSLGSSTTSASGGRPALVRKRGSWSRTKVMPNVPAAASDEGSRELDAPGSNKGGDEVSLASLMVDHALPTLVDIKAVGPSLVFVVRPVRDDSYVPYR